MNKKRLGEHLEKLSTFRIVADLKSVHRAASRLGLSQPAVSRTIKVLEDVLECQLMERQNKGIKLTAAGERLYEYAKLVNKTLEEFDPALDHKKPASKPFRIATYDNIACGVLSDLGSKLAMAFPQISISVGGPNSRILGDLIAERFDCVVIAQPRILPGVEYTRLYTERYGFFVSSKLFEKGGFRRSRTVSISHLKEFKLIAMPDAIAGANRSVDRLLWEVGLESVFSIDSYQVAVELVLDNHGIGIMPYSSAWREIRDGNIFELSVQEIPKKSFGTHDLALCKNSKTKNGSILLFEEMLSAFYRKLP